MVRFTALGLTFLTGFSGLAYEVAWEKYLATLLGSHSEATAAVLAIFLGALAVGYRLFGDITRRRVARARARGTSPRLLVLYGCVEAAIGLYVLAFPWLFQAGLAVSGWLPQTGPGLGFTLDVVLAALMIGPPAVLMGATIPVLTQALARSLEDATRFHALIYAFNSAGAFLGALAAGFVLIPALGLPGVMTAMGCVNLGAGAVFVVLGLPRRGVVALEPHPSNGADPPSNARAYAVAALCVGFSMMAIQTVLIRLGGLSFGASQFTFSMVVAVFVLCIALGSFAVSVPRRIPKPMLPAVFWLLTVTLLFLHGPLENLPYGAHRIRVMFRDLDLAFYPYYAMCLVALLVLMGLPILLSGATLPLLFHQLRSEVGELGASAGRLYSANTVGSLLGALLGGHWLLIWLDLDHVYRLAMGALLAASLLVTVRLYRLPRLAVFAMLGATSASVIVTPAWRPERLSAGVFRKRTPTPATLQGADAFFSRVRAKTIFYDDDPIASVSVHEDRSGGQLIRSLINNGKSDGSTAGDRATTVLLALVPALFAGDNTRALVIGFGTGITAGELAQIDSVQQVDVAEISPAVIEAAPLFDFANHDASRDPKVRIHQIDAYRLLRRSPERFDVIVSEPPNPWVTGVEMLYSREFLEIARDRLAPGGVYSQWIHEYEISDEALSLVLRTYRSVFDVVSVWYTDSADLLLLGFRDEATAFELDRVRRRVERPDFAAGLRRAEIEGVAPLLVHELMPAGVLHAIPLEGPLHTLYHPLLNHLAARAFFLGSRSRLPFAGYGDVADTGRRNSLLGRLSRSSEGLAHPMRVTELCRYRAETCETQLARWMEDRPESEAPTAMLQKLRAKGIPLDPGRIQRLRRLFGNLAGFRETLPPSEAVKFSRLYVAHYLHSAPFDPIALTEIWKRCKAPKNAPKACQRGIASNEALLTRGVFSSDDEV